MKNQAAEPAEVRGDLYQMIDTGTDGLKTSSITAIQAREAGITGVITLMKVIMSLEGQVLIDTIQILIIATTNRGESKVDESIDNPEADPQEEHGVKRPLSPGEILELPANYPRTITGEVMRTIEGMGRMPPQGGHHGGSRSFEMTE